MKKLMLLFLLATSLWSCRKNNNNNMVHATFLGRDFTKCSCCGGYKLQLDNGDDSYRFYSFPQYSMIDSNVYPQSVYVSYIITDSCGPIQKIKLTSIMK